MAAEAKTQQRPPTPTEQALAEAQKLLQLWVAVKAYFMRACTEEPIVKENEQAFLETKSEVSKLQRMLTSKMPEGLVFGNDRMQDFLRQAISMSHLRGLTKADRATMLSLWHYVFIYLSQAAGALQFINEGYTPRPKTKGKGGSNISDLKGAASKKKEAKPNPLTSPKTWVVILLLGAAGYFVFNAFNR
ncbi:MAG: hypothetical protein K1X53_13975 [Candidatus Sumerlaeaceae bacterium]|nr:hypothetical protein [Candidatus Sumerlaeaceae bacterium]